MKSADIVMFLFSYEQDGKIKLLNNIPEIIFEDSLKKATHLFLFHDKDGLRTKVIDIHYEFVMSGPGMDLVSIQCIGLELNPRVKKLLSRNLKVCSIAFHIKSIQIENKTWINQPQIIGLSSSTVVLKIRY